MATSSSSSSVSGSRGSSSSGPAAGFKVYGSVFKVSSRYQFLNPLGKGSYGVVWYVKTSFYHTPERELVLLIAYRLLLLLLIAHHSAAKDRETGQCVAIKKVSPMAKRAVDAKHTLREVLLLQFLGKHPNDDELYIVMDLMDTDMHRVIQSAQPLSDAHAKYFLHQLLRGVKYLHDNGVLHRDLKPGNLLLSKTCQLKIADFGLARKIPRLAAPIPDRPPMTEHVVTRWYRAPELMLQPDGLYDQSVDMWSVGCIFAEILGRKALFPGKNFLHQLTLIFEVLGAPSLEASTQIHSSQAQRFLRSLGKKPKVPFRTLFPNASDAAVDLLDRLLEFDPAKRISAQEALAHPYMQDIERKYRHRGGGVDPPAPMRVDFSFDSKNLTKMDLRALIVKEVDNLRKTSATRASTAATESASATNASEGEERRQRHADGEKKGIGLVSSDSVRANGGLHQTLAASANNMLATISRNNEERSPSSGDSREEDATESGSLKPQRSTTRLPGQDPTSRKLPTKRLTIPKSPKFSVMSWQKKREGSQGALGAAGATTSLR
ncbi:hypothetical protein BBJ28_00019540 [Nothophytophthora sp. Chile5]|nr:hypothetical protein BBJ28_00019540 [Nothophytophthora sp. Chile5]